LSLLLCAVCAPAQAIEFESDHLTIDDQTGKATLTGNVTVWNDTGTIKARRIVVRYASSGDTVISYEAFGKVRIDHSNINARSEYAFRDLRGDTLFLQEDAYVKRNRDEFWADRITIDLQSSQVDLTGSVRGHIRQQPQSEGGQP
jgi:lipopolysaccharide export system protein LptA